MKIGVIEKIIDLHNALHDALPDLMEIASLTEEQKQELKERITTAQELVPDSPIGGK